jgi:hypothetical protein
VEPLPKKRYLIVKVNPPEKESAAATRIKKRKAKPSEIPSEPPLKRARQKAGVVKDEIIEIDRKDFNSKGKNKEAKGKGKEVKGREVKGKGKAVVVSSTSSLGKDKDKKPKRSARTKLLPGCEWPRKSQEGGNKFHQKVSLLVFRGWM